MCCLFVDMKYLHEFVPKMEKRNELNDVCTKKMKMKNRSATQKGAGLKFWTHQYLYVSEYLGLGLGRKLYLPPLELLGSFCGIVSVVGSLISSVEGLSLCLDGGCGIGSHAVLVSLRGSDVYSGLSL